VTEVTGKAGSVVLFPECSLVSAWLSPATVCSSAVCPDLRWFAQHGALPWRGAHQRRTLLYRFNAGHASYTDSGSDHIDELGTEWTRYMTPEQRLVVSRPGFLGRRQGLAAEKLMEARARQSREREAGLARL
jgi:hypothetical protein